ncbi:MAG: type I 3-dehydroquinate dehydratase [Candidatus Altiarchaeota archaeon]
MICATIIEESVEEMVQKADKADSDLVELRLDYLEGGGNLELLKGIEGPIIVSCPPISEGGRFKGGEEERASVLKNALEFTDYLTVELRMERRLRDKLIKEAQNKNVRVIVSFHDFEKTPLKEEIVKVISEEMDARADIAKVAFKAKNSDDVVTLFQAVKGSEWRIPIIALAMGDAGKITRSLGLALGSYMTYAAVSPDKRAVEGQLTIEELKEKIEALRL